MRGVLTFAVIVITLTVDHLAGWAATPASPDATSADPVSVLQTYLRATYARDAAAAYALVSQADRAVKSRDEHARETGAFGAGALQLGWTLAELIQFENARIEADGDRAKVIFAVTIPDARAPDVRRLALDFDERALAALAPEDRQARAGELWRLAREGRMPMLRNDHEEWQLVAEDGVWRVHLNWQEAVEVRLEAVTKDDLPWAFFPLQPRILARPGETVNAIYRVRNHGDRDITGKARHVIDPAAAAKHLEVVACFCFLEHTLQPGGTADLPLTLRVDYDVPEGVRALTLCYEFYPRATFPEGGTR